MKKEMQAQFSGNSLQVFVLEENNSAIRWEEQGREFYLGGMLYDVDTIKKINGKTYLYCLNDDKEMQLLENMAKAVQSGNDNSANDRNGQHSIKFQLSDYIINDFEKLSYPLIISQLEYFNFDATLLSSYKPVDIHPPQA